MAYSAGSGKGGEALSVSQAIHQAAASVNALPTMCVVGEVSGFKGPNRKGHCYFEVKDESSKVEACLWKFKYDRVKDYLDLRDGARVLMTGSFNVYEPWGKLSFIIDTIQLEGEGALLQQIARLKRKLAGEGLLDEARKRKVPDFCESVCVVTSLSGSVRHDVRRTLQRRNPFVRITEVDCAVQGKEAPESIVAALAKAGSLMPDCVLLVRGGGSTEDLMCFNDESVCRAVAACPVPVVAAIGHEDDVTLAEEVADRRCSLPGAAAESVAPSLSEIVETINGRQLRLVSVMDKIVSVPTTGTGQLSRRLCVATDAALSKRRVRVEGFASRRALSDPMNIVSVRRTQLIQTEQRLSDSLPRMVARQHRTVSDLGSRLRLAGSRICPTHVAATERTAYSLGKVRVVEPFSKSAERLADALGKAHVIEPFADQTSRLAASLDGAKVTRPFSVEVDHMEKMLRAYSPLGVLERGYAIVRDADGHVLSDATKVSAGDDVTVMLGKGSIDARVTAAHDKAGE